MADIKTQIETAKEIRKQKGCIGIICSACPASMENSESTSSCRDKFGGQNVRNFDDNALTWFQNWLKENDVERCCRTCRFFWQNTKSGKSECPEGLPSCCERNNYYKWQPIPKNEVERSCKTCRFSNYNTKSGESECPEDGTSCDDSTGLHKWQPIPKEEPLKESYVITDIPEDEEIFIKACEKTGKGWELAKHNDAFKEYCRRKNKFPVKIYVDDNLRYGRNDYIDENEPETKIHYKDFLNIKEEVSKMKLVVLEIPAEEVYIDLKWFKDNDDCGAGKIYFINRYGKDAKIKWDTHYHDLEQENNSAGLKFMNEHKPQQQPEGDYVHIDGVNKSKLYYFRNNAVINRIGKVSGKYVGVPIDHEVLTGEWNSRNCGSLKEIVEDVIKQDKKVYEFKSFKEFIEAYQEGKI
jgi:hypothetical protein